MKIEQTFIKLDITFLHNSYCGLGAVQKWRQPKGGEGGVCKKMISDDSGGCGGSAKDDGWWLWSKSGLVISCLWILMAQITNLNYIYLFVHKGYIFGGLKHGTSSGTVFDVLNCIRWVTFVKSKVNHINQKQLNHR